MERLKHLMEREGITSQYELAKRTGINYKVLNHWFTKRANLPSEENINILSNYFHVNAAWLRYGDPQYAPKENDEIQNLLKEAERLGVKEEGISYLRFRIAEAKRLKHEGGGTGRKARHKVGKIN